MTQEEKELLLKDLCARLPYGVKAHIEHDTFYDEIEPYDGTVDTNTINDLLHNEKLEVRPYLRPMSSMTREEKAYWKYHHRVVGDGIFAIGDTFCIFECFEWLNSHHFDYGGLIIKGLALEALDDMYKDVYVDLADGKDKTVVTTYNENGNIVKQEIK